MCVEGKVKREAVKFIPWVDFHSLDLQTKVCRTKNADEGARF